jgi:hypothetical protein
MDAKKPEDLAKDLEGTEVTELEDHQLEDVAGGDVNCGNTQCCNGDSSSFTPEGI